MRRGILSILLLASGLLLCTASTMAQQGELAFERSPYVYRISIAGCGYKEDPNAINVQTGFRVQGTRGIITALHGVAGCNTFTARPDDNQEGFSNLEIRMVDIDRDVVLLGSDRLDALEAEGLVSASPEEIVIDQNNMQVIGYGSNVPKQLPLTGYRIQELLLKDIIPFTHQAEGTPLSIRNSPNLSVTVYHVQQVIQPGHSGAPVTTSGSKLVAIADGGIGGGQSAVNWAIPWHEVKLQPLADVQARYNELAALDPRPVLGILTSFATTSEASEEVNLIGVTEHYTTFVTSGWMRIDGMAAGLPTNEKLEFETYTDPDGDHFLELSGDLVDHFGKTLMGNELEHIKMTFYTVGNMDYARMEADFNAVDGTMSLVDMCLPATPELSATAEAFFGTIKAIAEIPLDTSNMGPGLLLSRSEPVDGKNANHYFLSTPSTELSQTNRIAEADVWVSDPGNYLLRLDGTIENVSLAGIDSVSGNATLSVQFSSLGSVLEVELPETCKSALPITVTTATPTIVPTPEPTTPEPRRAPATMTPTPAALPVAELGPIIVRHNARERVKGDIRNGLRISFDLTVENGVGVPGIAVAYFFLADGTPLLGTTPDYTALDGSLAVSFPFEAESNPENINIRLFLPYDEFQLPSGADSSDVRYQVYVFDQASSAVLAQSRALLLRYLPASDE